MTKKQLIFSKNAAGQYQFIDIGQYRVLNPSLNNRVITSTNTKTLSKPEDIDLEKTKKEVTELLKGTNCKSCQKKKNRRR